MSATIYTATLKHISCCHIGCGVIFGIENDYNNELFDSHQIFYCPNGHSQHYTAETEAETQRKRAERAERDAAWQKENARVIAANLASQCHKTAAERGAKTKLQKKLKRVAHGVCPDCHRTFENLARHMKTKHN